MLTYTKYSPYFKHIISKSVLHENLNADLERLFNLIQEEYFQSLSSKEKAFYDTHPEFHEVITDVGAFIRVLPSSLGYIPWEVRQFFEKFLQAHPFEFPVVHYGFYVSKTVAELYQKIIIQASETSKYETQIERYLKYNTISHLKQLFPEV